MYWCNRTNGKTSVSWICASIIAALRGSCLHIGTIGAACFERGEPPTFQSLNNTSPDPLFIQSSLAEARSKGVEYAVIEVTSQAVAQKRCHRIDWSSGVFTNLSRDHLDLHGSMKDYAELKFQLFSSLLEDSSARDRISVFNLDDECGLEFYRKVRDRHPNLQACGFSKELGSNAEYQIEEYECSIEKTRFVLSTPEGRVEFSTELLGRYNVWNCTASIATLHRMGLDYKSLKRP